MGVEEVAASNYALLARTRMRWESGAKVIAGGTARLAKGLCGETSVRNCDQPV